MTLVFDEQNEYQHAKKTTTTFNKDINFVLHTQKKYIFLAPRCTGNSPRICIQNNLILQHYPNQISSHQTSANLKLKRASKLKLKHGDKGNEGSIGKSLLI